MRASHARKVGDLIVMWLRPDGTGSQMAPDGIVVVNSLVRDAPLHAASPDPIEFLRWYARGAFGWTPPKTARPSGSSAGPRPKPSAGGTRWR